ncbi:hypothetical protein DXB23_09005 [Dorea sp. OM02-2LB]|nr:hypothetical protein DXB23_09005 [Dorea sp. OM02-2LB]
MFVGIADTFVVCFFSEADDSVILSVLAWIGIIVFERPVLTFDSQCASWRYFQYVWGLFLCVYL